MFDVEEVAHVREPADLLADRLDHGGVAVPEVDRADARDEVEVLPALVVVEPHPLAAHEHHGLARVHAHVERLVERLRLAELLAHRPHAPSPAASDAGPSPPLPAGGAPSAVIIVPTPSSVYTSSSRA